MAKTKIKSLKGVTVKFEMLDDNDNVIKVIAEKSFPDKDFTYHFDSWNHHIITYNCWDNEVGDYVYDQHCINDSKYDYANWEEAPNVKISYYNGKGEFMFWEDEVEYEMNL